MAAAADAVAGTDDLDAEIQRREAELAILKQQRADRQASAFLLILARVIPAGVVFSAGELMAHGRLDRELGQAIGPMTPKRLGHYLRTLALRPVSGILLQRCDDRDKRGCIWSIGFTP
jgi:hypothetical protein